MIVIFFLNRPTENRNRVTISLGQSHSWLFKRFLAAKGRPGWVRWTSTWKLVKLHLVRDISTRPDWTPGHGMSCDVFRFWQTGVIFRLFFCNSVATPISHDYWETMRWTLRFMFYLLQLRIQKQLGGFAQIFQDQDQDQDQDRETIRWVCSDLSGSGNN